jgi:hypothetical protein
MRGAAASALAIGLAFAFGVNGCSWRKATWELGIPGFKVDLSVAYVKERGPYLDAGLVGHGLDMRTFVPASDVCREVLNTQAPVTYVEQGVAGRFDRQGLSCEAVGFGDPRIRRARQPRSGASVGSPVPRAQATFHTIYEDDDVVLLRGRFPLASRIGWSGSQDSVAVVANSASCRGPVEKGVASMEYRQAGNDTLALVGSGELCRIEGLIQPLGGPAR